MSDPAEKFAAEEHDLDAVRKSVEDAASVSAGLWLSYLFVLLYIAIAAGAVTHRDLLLESPVKLPFLNVELPLVAFFFLAPILFMVSHAYTLVHFVMLAAKVGVFDKELYAQLGDAPETRESLRRQLPSNIFVQFLAGPSDIRKGGLGWLLKAIAWITLVIGPVLLLLLIQVQFLPYHLEWVTWVQRVAIVVDVILLWALWPSVLNGRSKIIWPRLWRHPVLMLTSLVPIGLAFTAATFPGEAMEDRIGKRQWIPPNGFTAWLGAKNLQNEPISTSFHDLLFNGEVDKVTRRRKSLFSNTLVLPYFDALEAAKIDDPKKLDSFKHTLVLRGRHLEKAVFTSADLRKADRESVQLQGASLGGAQFQGASLNDAQLQGAMLNDAHLQGASLNDAQLQGAMLNDAYLQGASLNDAELQDGSLDRAHLQGASLDYAQLQGARLDHAQLEGASLIYAQLEGASLVGALLVGADFQNSTFAGTNLGGAAVWRASFEGASLAAVFEDDLKEESAFSKDVFAALKVTIMKEVPEGPERKTREEAQKRIEKLNPDIFGPEASQTQALEKGRADKAAYQKALANELKSLLCFSDEKTASHIARALAPASIYIVTSRIFDAGPFAPGLIDSILAPACKVSNALTQQDRANLKKLAKEAQSRAGKP